MDCSSVPFLRQVRHMLHFMLISIVISEIPHLRQIPIQMPDSRAVQGCQVRDGGGRTDVRLLSTIVHN